MYYKIKYLNKLKNIKKIIKYSMKLFNFDLMNIYIDIVYIVY